MQSWATRTGARVTLRTDPTMPEEADVAVIASAELGSWAERGELTPVPVALRAADHPFQWNAVLPPYREQLIEWGGQARAIPLSGDGYVVVYRADRLTDPKVVAAFLKRTGKRPAEPSSWEDFAALAATLTALDGQPALPALTGREAADLFFRVAACYDRPARNESGVADPDDTTSALSFQYALASAAPRLETAGFRAAANWLAGLASEKCLPAPVEASDPVAALADGRACIAVLSLAQLDRLPRDNGQVPARFGVAALPGSRSFTDPRSGQLVSATGVNYIPYFAGGRLGVVRTRCARPEAAFDLLADLGGPTRSLEIISTPGLGAGPFRTTHLDQERLLIWLGYGFDPARSTALLTALRQYVRVEVKNPAYGLRVPHQQELSAAAARVIGQIAAGTVPAEAGLPALRTAWETIDARFPRDARQRWLRLSVGVN